MADLNRFFKRNDIEIEKILYIYHHGRNTIVCKDPGIEVSTSTPFRGMLRWKTFYRLAFLINATS